MHMHTFQTGQDGVVKFNFWNLGKDSPLAYYPIIVENYWPINMQTFMQHGALLAELANQNFDFVLVDPTYQIHNYILADLTAVPKVTDTLFITCKILYIEYNLLSLI